MHCTSSDGSGIAPLMDLGEVEASSGSFHNDGNEKIPDGKWWAGLVIYAATNCGFLKLFEVCSTLTDVSNVLMLMAIYYAAAFVLRYILRNILKIDKKHMPQFFWEPPFYPRRDVD